MGTHFFWEDMHNDTTEVYLSPASSCNHLRLWLNTSFCYFSRIFISDCIQLTAIHRASDDKVVCHTGRLVHQVQGYPPHVLICAFTTGSEISFRSFNPLSNSAHRRYRFQGFGDRWEILGVQMLDSVSCLISYCLIKRQTCNLTCLIHSWEGTIVLDGLL